MQLTQTRELRVSLAETQEQRELAAAVGASLGRGWSEAALSAFLASGSVADPEVVTETLAGLGLVGATIGEADGGLGLGWIDLAAALEELGRRLAPTTFLEALTASELLAGVAHGNTPADYLTRHLDGSHPMTAVVTAPASAWGVASDVRVAAQPDVAEVLIDGSVEHVGGGAEANYLMVLSGVDGPILVTFNARDEGVERSALEALDLLRPVSRIELTAVRATVVARGQAVVDAAARSIAVATFVLACEQVGAADRCLAASVHHAGQREQFGKPIGSFQAVRHRCADMLVQVELARSASRNLGAELDAKQRPVDALAVAVSLTRVRATRALNEASRGYIQILGAMGFTWEMDAHLCFRKAASTAVMFGSPTAHRRALGHHLGLIRQEASE